MVDIVCWGIGRLARESIEQLVNSGYNVKYCCDTERTKQGGVFESYPIISPEELKEKINHVNMIVITTGYWESIFTQCIKMEIGIEKIKYWDYEKKKLYSFDELYMMNIYSQDGEEVYLRERFSDKEKGMYVDVGSLHPFRFSNTYWAYKKGWSGINIEPNMENFWLFEKLRPRDINVNCGIANSEGMMKYYQFEEAAVNTFNYDLIEKKEQIKNEIEIPVRKLKDILYENHIQKIDFIDIDVEGMEMEVLKSIDFNIDIECILLEQLSYNPKASLFDILNSQEYLFLKDKGYEALQKYGRTVIYERK